MKDGLRLWDTAFDLGLQHTRAMQLMSKLISSHGQRRKPCILCNQVNLATSVLEHLLEQHINTLNLNEMTALERLTSGNIKFVYDFWNMSFNVFDVCKQSCSTLGTIDEPLSWRM